MFLLYKMYQNYGNQDFNGFRADINEKHQTYLNHRSAMEQLNVLKKSNALAQARQQFSQGTAMFTRGVEVSSSVPATALAAQAVANRVSKYAKNFKTLANETGDTEEGIELQDVEDTTATGAEDAVEEDVVETAAEDAVSDAVLGPIGFVAGAVQLGLGIYDLVAGNAEEEEGKDDETAAEALKIQPPAQPENFSETYVAPVQSVV
jgi:hypothetical protein